MAFGWKLYGDGSTPPPGAAVAPDERLSWPRTIGIGAQHVVAMFGATFVFPLIMGLDPNLAIMMSGVATIVFLLIVNNRVPSYLGTSASFVGGVGVIAAQGGGVAEKKGCSRCRSFRPAGSRTHHAQTCFRGSSLLKMRMCSWAARAAKFWNFRSRPRFSSTKRFVWHQSTWTPRLWAMA